MLRLLLETSTSCIPLAWKCGYSCVWTILGTSCYNASNFNCLLRPLVTTLDISKKSLIHVSFGQGVIEKIKDQHAKKI